MSHEAWKLPRRALFQLVASGSLASAAMPHGPCQVLQSAAPPSGPYQFQFFSPREAALFESVAEQIIPVDENSPGAREARVVEFADLMIDTGSALVKEDWRSGLRLLAAELRRSGLLDWLDRVSESEDDPRTVLEVFFRTIKEMTINGYYSSAIGIHQDLKYQGNTYVQSFPGCDHPEHKG